MSCVVQNPLLGAPPHHGGGGHGGGGHHGRGNVHPARIRRGGPRNWNTVPEFEVVLTSACSSWGFPAPMNPDFDYIGKRLLSQNGGQPASAYYDGTLYLFSYRDGTIRAQPCTSVRRARRRAATGLLYYLYRSTIPVGDWAIVGGWYTVDDVQDEMLNVLKMTPTAQLGAYVWDGATMTWRFF